MAMAIQGWAQYFLGDVLTAESTLKQSLALDPNNGLAHAYYAEVLSEGGKFEQAGEASRQAVNLASDKLEAYRARGIVLELTGNYEEAIAEYQAALRINPNIADLHIAIGRNYATIQNFDAAEEAFIRANSLKPSDPLPDSYLANTYARIGQFSKAVQYAELAVQDDPSDPALYGSLGIMLYRNGQRAEAIEPLRLAVMGGTSEGGLQIEGIALAPGRVAEYYSTFALALARTNECGEALQIVQMLLTGVPEDETAQFNANEAQVICQENLNATPTPEAVEAMPEGVEATPTP
jgi:tetratricopeptide (TPR) repeat protein